MPSADLTKVLAQPAVEAILAAGVPSFAKRAASTPGTGGTAIEAARVEAMFEAVVLASTADGEVSPAASREIAAVMAELTAGAMDAAAIDAWLRKTTALIARDGFAVRASYLGRALDDDEARKGAFALATAVALRERDLDAAAKDHLDLLSDSMDLDPDDAAKILSAARAEAKR